MASGAWSSSEPGRESTWRCYRGRSGGVADGHLPFSRDGTEYAQYLTRTVLHSLTHTSSSTYSGSFATSSSRIAARSSATRLPRLAFALRATRSMNSCHASTLVKSRRPRTSRDCSSRRLNAPFADSTSPFCAEVRAPEDPLEIDDDLERDTDEPKVRSGRLPGRQELQGQIVDVALVAIDLIVVREYGARDVAVTLDERRHRVRKLLLGARAHHHQPFAQDA